MRPPSTTKGRLYGRLPASGDGSTERVSCSGGADGFLEVPTCLPGSNTSLELLERMALSLVRKSLAARRAKAKPYHPASGAIGLERRSAPPA